MNDAEPLSPKELERRLREIGEERYHIHHPFHHLLHDGQLSKGQVQAWALNRYYYQASIPAKDASLVARLPTPDPDPCQHHQPGARRGFARTRCPGRIRLGGGGGRHGNRAVRTDG